MRALVVVLLLLLPAALAACLSPDPVGAADGSPAQQERPAPHPDPLAPGDHSFTSSAYEAAEVIVGGPDRNHTLYQYTSKVRGQLWMPVGDGPFPLAVFLHGQHTTCGAAGREAVIMFDECEGKTVFEPYPNHLGYTYLAEHLASHGIATASILAKEINDRNGRRDVGMWARGELVLATIDALLDGSVAEAAGRLDPERVGIMGHSRGGEGVVTAVHVNLLRPDPLSLSGVVALAPTDFNARGVPDVPLLSLVPYCDGDVFDLHGLRTYDHSRFADVADADPANGTTRTVKLQHLSMGANHNFYNTAWAREPLPHVYDGDDGLFSLGRECMLPDDLGGGRLGAEDVKVQAIVQIGGFLRWVLLDEVSLLPYLDGSMPLPDAACPNGAAPCPRAVLVSALLPDRTLLWNTTGEAIEMGPGSAGALRLEGFVQVDPCGPDDCERTFYSAAGALDLGWEGPAVVRVPLAAGVLDTADVLAFRVAVPVEGDYDPERVVGLTVALLDAEGNVFATSAAAHSEALRQPPGREPAVDEVWRSAKLALNMVRIPLDAFEDRPDDVSTLELRFDPSEHGRILLGEGWVQSERVDVVAP